MNYLMIEPIELGELKEKTANAINWSISLTRNQLDAVAFCNLLFVDGENSIEINEPFQVDIPNHVLQNWGSSDDVIDNHIILFSPLFKKL